MSFITFRRPRPHPDTYGELQNDVRAPCLRPCHILNTVSVWICQQVHILVNYFTSVCNPLFGARRASTLQKYISLGVARLGYRKLPTSLVFWHIYLTYMPFTTGCSNSFFLRTCLSFILSFQVPFKNLTKEDFKNSFAMCESQLCSVIPSVTNCRSGSSLMVHSGWPYLIFTRRYAGVKSAHKIVLVALSWVIVTTGNCKSDTMQL